MDKEAIKETIISAIGAERYKAACQEIRIPDPKTKLHQLKVNQKVPYEIGDIIWGSPYRTTDPALAWIQQLSDVAKVELTVQFFREIPFSSLLEYIQYAFEIGLSAEARNLFWQEARACLAQDDEMLAKAMAGSIGFYFLSMPSIVDEAWAELTGEHASEKQLERLLSQCASVPFRLREPLYRRLLANLKWHPYIFHNLRNSDFRENDKAQKERLLAILQQLNLESIDSQAAQRLALSPGKQAKERAIIQRQLEKTALVNKATVIHTVGDEQYRAACETAQKEAPGTGTKIGAADTLDYDCLFQIDDCIWESGLTDTQKVDLTFQVYKDIPCYHFMTTICMQFDHFSTEAKKCFWDHVRALLSQENAALADPVSYSMWCDFFEDHGYTQEAWTELTRPEANDIQLQHVLISSGPIPFSMKEPLYARMVEDKKWHYFIYRSLLHSEFDVLGDINRDKARTLLDQLDLPENTEHLSKLRKALQQN